MALLGIDLGGTKLSFAVFDEKGALLDKEIIGLKDRSGTDVGNIITSQILKLRDSDMNPIRSIGISVPGIYRVKTGNVWAPNIPGWDDYPLLKEVKKVSKEIPVSIDSDRACYILGETWQGNAQQCKDAIFLAVGTGIGAGILINGNILRGADDIAGAIGWMALARPFKDEYVQCGCFEYYASGEGIAKITREILKETRDYSGEFNDKPISQITSHDVFIAYENNDPLAKKVIEMGIEFWGMAVANLVSLFNPEKIILGGGVFGPATKLIPGIKMEASKWAQPISIKKVSVESSALGGDAGAYGAGFLALKNSIT
ncbi:MAG: ROK family protein [Ginsengibacter sp.]